MGTHIAILPFSAVQCFSQVGKLRTEHDLTKGHGKNQNQLERLPQHIKILTTHAEEAFKTILGKPLKNFRAQQVGSRQYVFNNGMQNLKIMDLHVLQTTVVNALKSFMDETLPAVHNSISQLSRVEDLQTALTHLRSLKTLVTNPENFDGVLNQEATDRLDFERGRVRQRIDRLRARLESLNELIIMGHNHALNMERVVSRLNGIDIDTDPAGILGAPVV
ncbi:unnamed protein product [Brassica rapa subsp. trilocularis]|uniref:Uncharacterized protein n=1 Tax=Brassica campestris TaxID=3711 RepID=M4E623_BRACM